MKINLRKGFTLLELLVVVAIIGILSAVIMAALNNANTKGKDAAIKSNLKNAITQGEIFYATNTVALNSYTNVCNAGPIGGANTVYNLVLAAAKASALASYGIDNVPAASASVATCNDTAGGWAAEVPLKSAGANQMWCVDSTGKSVQTAGSTLASAADVTCN
jgi:prepilin-type N-terminal cleavage/methylation domain-containing protein